MGGPWCDGRCGSHRDLLTELNCSMLRFAADRPVSCWRRSATVLGAAPAYTFEEGLSVLISFRLRFWASFGAGPAFWDAITVWLAYYAAGQAFPGGPHNAADHKSTRRDPAAQNFGAQSPGNRFRRVKRGEIPAVRGTAEPYWMVANLKLTVSRFAYCSRWSLQWDPLIGSR